MLPYPSHAGKLRHSDKLPLPYPVLLTAHKYSPNRYSCPGLLARNEGTFPLLLWLLETLLRLHLSYYCLRKSEHELGAGLSRLPELLLRAVSRHLTSSIWHNSYIASPHKELLVH